MTRLVLILGSALLLLTSCTVGPDYQRPEQRMPTTYKSATTQEATTQPSFARDWWRLFGDETLNSLEESAIGSNTDLQAAMARVLQARAAARISNSDFYPVITFDPSIQRERLPPNNRDISGNTNNTNIRRTGRMQTDVRIPLDLSYEVDIWGKIRRGYESAVATARASEYDYQVVLQTLQADVATNYFTYRSLAAQEQILQRTVDAYRQQVELTQKALRAGVNGPLDYQQANTLLHSTISQQVDLERQLRDTEHAIAILLGRAPSELALAPAPLDLSPPDLPAGLPADLLRRRPDVAVAEQNLISANAQVGVAQSLFYPSLNLTGAVGFEAFDVSKALDWEQRIWSIGANAALPLFEGGRLNANLEQAKARYQELNATYRGAVLGAIRDVEDSLTDMHLRSGQADAQEQAINSAREYLRLSQLQYRQGLISYLQVIDAERTLQSNELQGFQILNERLIASVRLIKSLGGGWDIDNK